MKVSGHALGTKPSSFILHASSFRFPPPNACLPPARAQSLHASSFRFSGPPNVLPGRAVYSGSANCVIHFAPETNPGGSIPDAKTVIPCAPRARARAALYGLQGQGKGIERA